MCWIHIPRLQSVKPFLPACVHNHTKNSLILTKCARQKKPQSVNWTSIFICVQNGEVPEWLKPDRCIASMRRSYQWKPMGLIHGREDLMLSVLSKERLNGKYISLHLAEEREDRGGGGDAHQFNVKPRNRPTEISSPKCSTIFITKNC